MSTQVEPVVVEAAELEEQVATVEQPPLVVDKQLVARLVGDAQRQGLSVDGEGGLLAQLTKLVVESALEGELSAHLGYDKHERWWQVQRPGGDDGRASRARRRRDRRRR